jgi:hypothetical protein
VSFSPLDFLGVHRLGFERVYGTHADIVKIVEQLPEDTIRVIQERNIKLPGEITDSLYPGEEVDPIDIWRNQRAAAESEVVLIPKRTDAVPDQLRDPQVDAVYGMSDLVKQALDKGRIGEEAIAEMCESHVLPDRGEYIGC